jgi:hypothetical protein
MSYGASAAGKLVVNGATLVGRRTSEVGDRMGAEELGSVEHPFTGPIDVLTHGYAHDRPGAAQQQALRHGDHPALAPCHLTASRGR